MTAFLALGANPGCSGTASKFQKDGVSSDMADQSTRTDPEHDTPPIFPDLRRGDSGDISNQALPEYYDATNVKKIDAVGTFLLRN